MDIRIHSMFFCFIKSVRSVRLGKIVICFLFFITQLALNCVARPPLQMSSTSKGQFTTYAEFLGHNFYGFTKSSDRGIISANVGYRKKLGERPAYLLVSVGWGTYKTYQSSKASGFGHVHYIPLEIALQIGPKKHCVEAGICVTQNLGEQFFRYEGVATGGGPPGSLSVSKTYAVQFVPRIGYAYCSDAGIIFRVSYTPHLYPPAYNLYNGYTLKKPDWLPIGISFGWIFQNTDQKIKS